MGRKKPSMFSKNYQKQMKKRRRRYILLILACAFFVGGGILYATSIKDKVTNIMAVNDEKKKNSSNESNEELSKDKEETNKEVESAESKVEKLKEVVVNIENKNVKIQVENESGNIISFDVDKSIEGDVSPNKHNLLLIEKTSQNAYIINNEGKVKDVTRKEYVSTEGEVFTKESVMENNQGYLWMGTPKFVSDDTIVYTSYLPWISSENNQYIWSSNINTLEQKPYYELVGKDVKFGGVESKGIAINIDGKVVYLNSKGEIVK